MEISILWCSKWSNKWAKIATSSSVAKPLRDSVYLNSGSAEKFKRANGPSSNLSRSFSIIFHHFHGFSMVLIIFHAFSMQISSTKAFSSIAPWPPRDPKPRHDRGAWLWSSQVGKNCCFSDICPHTETHTHNIYACACIHLGICSKDVSVISIYIHAYVYILANVYIHTYIYIYIQ